MWIRHRFELAVVLATALVSSDAWAQPPSKPDTASDSLAAYRERFQLGMAEYRSGAVANAIAQWEPVYLALGPREGYRVAYDLGVAYLQVGDATLAAERLQSFLDEVTVRRESGNAVSAFVTKEEGDARARIANLVATQARIQIDARSGIRAQIDQGSPRPAGFVAWVAPGHHTVVFSTPTEGLSEPRIVGARAGELVEVPAPLSVASSPAGSPTDAPPPSRTNAMASPPPTPPQGLEGPNLLQLSNPTLEHGQTPDPVARPTPLETRVHHPVSPSLVIASGAIAAVAVAIAIPLGVHTFSLHSRLVDERTSTGFIPAADRQSFDETRTAYDLALGSAIAFGVLTTSLASWYFAGSSRENVPVEPVVSHEHGGASLALRGRF